MDEATLGTRGGTWAREGLAKGKRISSIRATGRGVLIPGISIPEMRIPVTSRRVECNALPQKSLGEFLIRFVSLLSFVLHFYFSFYLFVSYLSLENLFFRGFPESGNLSLRKVSDICRLSPLRPRGHVTT